MNERVPSAGFLLSQAYISQRAKRPSLTAIQIVRDAGGPSARLCRRRLRPAQPAADQQALRRATHWRQIKGDPAIRGTVFHQTRSDSQMDIHLDTVLGVLEELMTERGVFHVILHFSSSRAVIWLFDDPYRYRLLDIDALTDPNTCLAYPKRSYPDDALISARPDPRRTPKACVSCASWTTCSTCAAAPSTSSMAFVGLTFSCDGSHYLPWDEFLSKGYDFWASGKALG